MNATPRVIDNDRDEITVTLDGKEIRGWSYADEAERRVKMRMAREFVEGWLQAREPLTAALRDAVECLDGEPEYHYSGMGCGLEDRGITDRYEAMQHGWDCAMERVASEHVIPARDLLRAALLKAGG